MSLPKGFITSEEYFRQANEFLKQHSWIYRAANTEFLKADILQEIPQDFKNYFIQIGNDELNQFPYAHEPLHNLKCPILFEFRQNLAKLIPLKSFEEPKDIKKPLKLVNLKKMNIKKQHEIQRLQVLVKECLEKYKTESEQKIVLIDLGSGLGYLSELLYKLNQNVFILGLEADTYRVEAAEKRIKTYMPTAVNSIQYRKHFVTENSKDFILKTAEEVFKLNYPPATQQTDTKMFIIGLHACADLTINSMKLFFQLPQVQQLIIMPCCYHKLQVCNDVAATNAAAKHLKFRNFPMSESLQQVVSDKTKEATNEHFTSYLNRPFLRLACQQTLKRWRKRSAQEHRAHGCEMFFRAVAELLLCQGAEETQLEIVKRKEENIDLQSLSEEEFENFETFKRFYVLKIKTSKEVIEWTEEHRKTFNEINGKYPNGAQMAEGLTCLQTSIQKLCENLVLYDRLCFMEETALKMNLKIKVHYEKIMDEELSPRCYALIAEKI